MSDRLQQLRRQRAVVAEHLAWLDREIDTALGTPAQPPAPTAPTVTPPIPAAPVRIPVAVAPPLPVEDPAVAAVADEIIQQYHTGPDTTKSDVRKGCFLYFFAALALVALAVVAIFYFYQSRP